jgi:hypothetical protein
MSKNQQSGSASSAVLIALLVVGLFVSLTVAVWAFFKMQDYRTNTDQKIAAAVKKSIEEQKKQFEIDFANRAKQPYRSFQGPGDYGSVTFEFPQNWSMHLEDTSPSRPVSAYFNPGYTPSINNRNKFALKVEVSKEPYDKISLQYQGRITSGSLRAVTFIPPKLAGNTKVLPGLRLEGEVGSGKKGVIAIVGVGERTLILTTEDLAYLTDFNAVVLASLNFTP